MRIRAIFDVQKRTKARSIISKRLRHLFRGPTDTTPVFVFGKGRSGTSMLMYAFHLRPDTEVWDESADSKAFLDYRIRDHETLERLIRQSKYSFACFKPICDSHLIREFADRTPQGRFIWIYRDYRDVANSSLRKFARATTVIKIICNGETGGGWFQEGVSEETAAILRDVYSPELSEFDLACLAWWARNRIFVEEDLAGMSNLMLIRYEDMVTNPGEFFGRLARFVGFRSDRRAYRLFHSRSISKNEYPPVTPAVRELCEDLMDHFESALTNV